MSEYKGIEPEERAISPSEPDDLQFVVHHAQLPQTALSDAVDQSIRWIGNGISWVWLALVAVIILNVTMRYSFGEGRIEFEEIQWHIYSVGFLIGLSYCLEADDHVRIDLFHERFSLRTKAWIELFGILLFLIPFLVLVFFYAIPFVSYAISSNEISEAPGGLPLRWVVKAVLPLGFLLLGLATFSRLLRVTAHLFGLPRPTPRTE
jgi:TRAP-type mannitol/chloroaromatic compound transport system permease small subunit